jgi:hypothetical protein
MNEIKLTTTMKQTFKGGNYDFRVTTNNKRKTSELMPQGRRPKNISKAHDYKVENIGVNYDIEPYPNYLGSK